MQRRGTSASGMKDLGAKFTAMMQGLSGTVMADEVVKGAMASYTFEHLEVSAYRCLVAAADQAGDAETARVCGEILQEELSMAAWLDDHLPQVTRTFLQRAAADMSEAKR